GQTLTAGADHFDGNNLVEQIVLCKINHAGAAASKFEQQLIVAGYEPFRQRRSGRWLGMQFATAARSRSRLGPFCIDVWHPALIPQMVVSPSWYFTLCS